MATITPPAAARNLGEYQRRVRSPLTRLRGYIRVYVGLEGALLLVLLLAGCFWVSLTLDYGLFKAARFDWVQAWPWGVRLVLFLLAAAGVLTIVTTTVLRRLLREFSDPALALVLERRFPRLLGDRLITAVELADLKKAQEQGYSPVMVLETIHEAAERVQQVPVAKVFDWRRLIVRGVLAVGLTLGLYLLAGGLFLTLDFFRHVHGGRIGYSRFNEVVQMWAERNVLAAPHRLDAAGAAGAGQRPRDRVARRQERHGAAGARAGAGIRHRRTGFVGRLRALTWNDLLKRPDLIGANVPSDLPFTLTPRNPSGEATVDQAARALGALDVRAESGSGRRGWQTADPKAAGGWRPLLWADLKSSLLNGLNPPPLPDWDGKPAAEKLTVDDVEQEMAAHQEEDRIFDAAAKALMQLEELGHAANGPVRIVKDGPVKWQSADPAAPGGWRPLLWADAAKLNPPALPPEWTREPPLPLVGSSAVGLMSSPIGQGPSLAAAALLAGRAAEPRLGITVDDVEAALAARQAARETRTAADVILQHLDRIAAVHDVLDRINSRVEQPEMSRTMRGWTCRSASTSPAPAARTLPWPT